MSMEQDQIIMDRRMKYDEAVERSEHGSGYGLRRVYHFCDQCQLGFGGYTPYRLVHFFHNGLWYGIPRPIRGLMPACPECRSRDHVHRLNRYKKVKNTSTSKEVSDKKKKGE